ncbi:thioredoxin family protein [Mycoplasmopsis gallinacea]|uniref:DUF953 domain-containing protein n=1 Tax=Mycoplasmopsis gallinacea TaxID=29556 RepID=A0A6H0V1R2_9BACT|nr:thioredoxin family protein [Mycoplasmopsis gallinacea]QIW62142.1 DUF953 domain-containing protein [Mycoplasmopsis gallinacea]
MFEKMLWQDAEKFLASNKNKLIFLEFTTEWCGDCKMMKPVVDSVASEYKDNNNISFINVDAEEAKLFRNPDTKWKVLKVPTILLIKNEEILEKGYEYIPAPVLKSWIEKSLH